MRVLRAGGEYLATRLRQARQRLSAAVLIGALLALLVGGWLHPLFGLLTLAATMAAGIRLHARRIAPVQKGIRGEQLVTDLLRRLPSEFYLINDVTLPRHRGNVDHVVIGPCGVVVVETKHYSGTVRTFSGTWYVNGRARSNVCRQADRAAIAVREFLVARHPDLRGSALRFVDAVVVFTNPLCRVKVRRVRPSTTVVRYSQLLDVIREKASQRRLGDSTVRQLAQTLELCTSRP